MPAFTRALAVAGLTCSVLALAACGGGDSTSGQSASPTAAPSSAAASPSASASPSSTVKASDNLSAIKVSGDYGKAPKVSFKAPFAIDKTRTEVLKPSNGPVATASSMVSVNYYGVNGRTGKVFDQSYERGAPVAFSLAQVVPGFQKGLNGQHQGSRVLIAMPGSDGYDSSGGNAQAGINVGDTLIFVVDIEQVQLSGPSGSAVKPKDGLPTVTDTKGVPTVTVPKTAAPKTLQVQPLIKGSGPKVGETDAVTINYLWQTWDGRQLETTYGQQPASLDMSKALSGLKKGLVGQTVGSRVLVVVPPGSDGYPDGNAKPKVEKTDTLVFVVDILFSQPAQ
ncbi:FKBP-type peptidyl-prolyl cis-trans isomerase [Microlunatus ginsengisoli]|uniref:peptidylprolyl isomerase n=1 Tax=Microlunatus ginsengisoli TaxID=363863 RepID=A0ABP6ZA73_9ACTN